MRLRKALGWWVVAVLLVTASVAAQEVQRKKRKDQPEFVVVQHLLVAFKRSVPGKKFERTKKEAEKLAAELMERARTEEDFDALVKEFTDDSYPGIYTLTNTDSPLLANSRSRDQMVPSFGDLAFNLEVDQVGLARYHGGNSPYGWHIIKRIE